MTDPWCKLLSFDSQTSVHYLLLVSCMYMVNFGLMNFSHITLDFLISWIPKHILLEILGPSNVSDQIIRKIINIATTQYVSKICFCARMNQWILFIILSVHTWNYSPIGSWLLLSFWDLFRLIKNAFWPNGCTLADETNFYTSPSITVVDPIFDWSTIDWFGLGSKLRRPVKTKNMWCWRPTPDEVMIIRSPTLKLMIL